jgi:hypothetical protein
MLHVQREEEFLNTMTWRGFSQKTVPVKACGTKNVCFVLIHKISNQYFHINYAVLLESYLIYLYKYQSFCYKYFFLCAHIACLLLILNFSLMQVKNNN